MTFKIASRVWQTSATTGTGTLSLDTSSNPTGYRTFASAIGNGNSCPYVIDDGQGHWEEGIGTVATGPDTLARTTVLNNNLGTTAQINFPSGTKTVQICPIGSRAWWWNSAPTTDQIGIANSAGGMDPISIAAYFKKLLTTAGDFAVNVAGTVVRQTPTQVAALIQSLFTAVTASGAGTFGGLLDISGASAGQIKFPATQNASSNANTLDDYEEGTWTPTLFGATTAGSPTYTSQIGSYEKVGKTIHLRGFVFISAKGTMAGTVAIGGLPFASESGTNKFSSGMCGNIYGVTLSAGNTFVGLQSNGVTSANFTQNGSGLNADVILATAFASSSGAIFSMTYRTD